MPGVQPRLTLTRCRRFPKLIRNMRQRDGKVGCPARLGLVPAEEDSPLHTLVYILSWTEACVVGRCPVHAPKRFRPERRPVTVCPPTMMSCVDIVAQHLWDTITSRPTSAQQRPIFEIPGWDSEHTTLESPTRFSWHMHCISCYDDLGYPATSGATASTTPARLRTSLQCSMCAPMCAKDANVKQCF